MVVAVDAARGHLVLGEAVDRHVAPGGVVGWQLASRGPTRRAATAGRGGAAPPAGPGGTQPPSGPPVGSAGSCTGSPPPRGRRRRAPRRPRPASGERWRRTASPGSRWSTGPSPATVRTAPAQVGQAPGPTSPRPRTRRRDVRAGTTRRRRSGTAARYPRPRTWRPRRIGSSRPRGETTIRPAASACPTPPPIRGSGSGTAASTPSCGRTSATSGRRGRARAARSPRRTTTASCPTSATATAPTRTPRCGARSGASTITQPPMYGHAVAELSRLGFAVDGDDRRPRDERACGSCSSRRRPHRGRPGGALPPVGVGLRRQPALGRRRPRGVDARRAWFDRKGELVGSIERSAGGAPLHNPAFAVGSAGFSALVAWNALELAAITGDDALRRAGDELAEAVDARWDAELATWVDDGPTADGVGRRPHARRAAAAAPAPASGGDRRADRPRRVRRALRAPRRPSRRAHLRADHLLARPGLAPAHLPALAAPPARCTTARPRPPCRGRWSPGPSTSGFSEYWEADTGRALGAVPQTWSTLVVALAAAADE